MKIFKWAVTGIIGLVVVLLGLIYLNVLPGYDIYIVRSGSMSPVINAGDLAVTVPTDSFLSGGLEIGAIITYQRDDKTVTHRIIEINPDGSFITRGDDNEDPDPTPVTLSQVNGVYSFRIPYLGYVAGFARTKIGWFLLVMVPAFLLLSWIAWDIVKAAWRKERPAKPRYVTPRPVKSGVSNSHRFKVPPVKIRMKKNDPVKEYLEEVLKDIEFKS